MDDAEAHSTRAVKRERKNGFNCDHTDLMDRSQSIWASTSQAVLGLPVNQSTLPTSDEEKIADIAEFQRRRGNSGANR